jgi:uncharacterized protein YdaU (DUF1376 family)
MVLISKEAAMAKLRWFKFFPGDWALDTQGMSAQAKGFYIDLLCMQWAGRRLPADRASLELILPGLTDRAHAELMQHFSVQDGHLVNGRLERERVDAEKRTANAKAGAKKKWEQCFSNAPALPQHMLQQCYSDTEAEAEKVLDTNTNNSVSVSLAASPKRRKRARKQDTISHSPETGWTGITDADIAAWEEAYPGVNIRACIAASHQWILSKPERAPRSAYRRFLTAWMGRERSGIGSQHRGSAGLQRETSHIPADADPKDHHLWFMTDGRTPRRIPIYRTVDGRQRWLSGDYADEETTPTQGSAT